MECAHNASVWETGKNKKVTNRINLDILGLAEVRNATEQTNVQIIYGSLRNLK